MNRQLRDLLVQEYEMLDERARVWRDGNGKLYGCGLDAVRKLGAVKAFAESHGYRFVNDEDGPGCLLNFDASLARLLEIPATYWPEDAETKTCQECGGPVEEDPDGSEGVWVHSDTDAKKGRDLDAEHVAILDKE